VRNPVAIAIVVAAVLLSVAIIVLGAEVSGAVTALCGPPTSGCILGGK
jgi:hypothetical protein